jgi:hypothetical protein
MNTLRKTSLVLVLVANLFPASAMAFWGGDKREICANWEASDVMSFKNELSNALAYRKKLGIKTPYDTNDTYAARDSVRKYCEFYKS